MTAMDLNQFRALAEIYGSDLGRWPQPLREPARALLAQNRAAVGCLEETARLDEALDLWTTPAPDADLRQRVLLTAPPPLRPRQGRAAVWLFGAGLAAAALAGVFCGAAASSLAIASERDDALVASATAEGWGPSSGHAEAGANAQGAPASPNRVL